MFRVLLPGRDEVPLLLLGDPAYPLLSHCMKEYSTCYSNEDVMLNTMLRSARNQIECAHDRLKARWQILTKAMNLKLEDIPQLIYACFVMHNYCELNNTGLDEQVYRGSWILREKMNKQAPGFTAPQLLEELIPEVS